MKYKITELPMLVYNKIFADIRRSKWYAKQVEKNPRRAVNIKWLANHHKLFPWSNPQTLDEKITWLQVNTDTSEWSRLADKYEVREYVKEKVGEEYLIPCYGVWDNVEDIDFENLPNQFVIKCTHDCGSTIVVKDKTSINLNKVKEKLQKHLCKKIGYSTFEPHYFKIRPRIIAEKILEADKTTNSIIDYKFWCLDGKPFLCLCCFDREGHNATKEIYQISPWKLRVDWFAESKNEKAIKELPEPKNLDLMISIVKNLSENIPEVRVDLYNINGEIYFGEMTFTACSVNQMSYSKDVLMEMGKRITLPYK